jgi:hypothetical protein
MDKRPSALAGAIKKKESMPLCNAFTLTELPAVLRHSAAHGRLASRARLTIGIGPAYRDCRAVITVRASARCAVAHQNAK